MATWSCCELLHYEQALCAAVEDNKAVWLHVMRQDVRRRQIVPCAIMASTPARQEQWPKCLGGREVSGSWLPPTARARWQVNPGMADASGPI